MSNKQKQDIVNSLQSGRQLVIKSTKTQSGGFLGTLLASIGVPLAIEAIKKLTTGKGAPRMGNSGNTKNEGGGSAPRVGIPRDPPPFFGNWPQNTIGYGKK